MSFNINHVVVSGNLTADPEVRSLPSGTTVVKLRVAHNSRVKDGASGEWTDKPNYFDVTYWGNFGEALARNLSKGSRVVCSGELRWREWETEGGGKRQAVDINGRDIITFDNSGNANGGGFSERDEPVAAPVAGDPLSGTTGPPPGGNTPPPAEDDIPF